MAKAYIQFYTKTYSLYGDCKQIETDVVPRVGELIDAREFLDLAEDLVGGFMVLSVIYKLTATGFVPYITARQWHRGLRYELLQERGWLLPDDSTEFSYDEDDNARWVSTE